METNIINNKKEVTAKVMKALRASGQLTAMMVDQLHIWGGYKHKSGVITYSMHMASIQIMFRDDATGTGTVTVYGTWDYDPETTAQVGLAVFQNLKVKIVHQTGELETNDQAQYFMGVLNRANNIAEALRAEFENCKVNFTSN